jgi:Peptidase A4 family
MVLPGVVFAAPLVANTHVSLATNSESVYGQPGQYLSYNWAGYATFDQTTGSVTRASGSWVEPAVTCPTRGTTYAAFWVGIDGFTSDAVEQTGTLAVCQAGSPTYYAWWELFPTNAIQVINTMTVTPGDHFTATVLFHAKAADFTMTIADNTAATSFSITAAQASAYAGNAMENSAECIIERPAEINSTGAFQLLHLANFGMMSFSGCTATIGGTAGGVGSFSPAAVLYMIGEQSTATHIIYLASPGAPKNLVQWGFKTTWQKSL